MASDFPGPTAAFRVRSNVATNIPDAVDTIVNFTTTDYDEFGGFNLTTDVFTVPVSGLWYFYGIYEVGGTGCKYLQCMFFINGVNTAFGPFVNIGNTEYALDVQTTRNMTTGDTIAFRINNFSGSGTATGVASLTTDRPRFEGRRVGPQV